MDFINDNKHNSTFSDFSNEINDEVKSSLIVVIDDMEFNLLIIKEILNSNGFNNVKIFDNPREALTQLESINPDLIILDLVMPEFDGFDFLKAVRKNPNFAQIPIIVQTVINGSQQKEKAFTLGATDFITKPIDNEIVARANVHLEQRRLYGAIYQSKIRIQAELDDAKKMQDSIMPDQTIISNFQSRYDCKLKTYFMTSSEIGGDFWGFKGLSQGKFALYTVDFSGHGVTAAMNIFRLHALMNQDQHDFYNPALFLEKLNRQLINLLTPGHFATMFYGVVDLEENTLKYATAGCPNPIIYSKEKNYVYELDGSGFPIGAFKEATYSNNIINFPSGNIIMLYSDALIETEDESGNFLELDKIKHIIQSNCLNHTTAEYVASNCYDQIMSDFNKNYANRLSDDLTLNIYCRN